MIVVKTDRSIVYSCLLAAGVVAICSSAKASSWRYDVLPDCTPNVQMPMPIFGGGASRYQVRLTHRLVFDGLRYQSRVAVDGLNSALWEVGVNRLRWRRLDGLEIVLIVGVPTSGAGGVWTVRATGRGGWEVSNEYGSERYVFEECRARSALIDGDVYRWHPDGDRAWLLVQEQDGERRMVRMEYGRMGEMERLVSDAGTWRLEYNEQWQLLRCLREGSERSVVDCVYSEGLLTKMVDNDGGEERWEWGLPEYREYVRLLMPLAPIVMRTSGWVYTAARGHSIVTVVARSRSSGVSDRWEYDMATGRVLRWERMPQGWMGP